MRGNLSDFTTKVNSTCKNVLKEYKGDFEAVLGKHKINSIEVSKEFQKDNDEQSR